MPTSSEPALVRRLGGYREAPAPDALSRYVQRLWTYERPVHAPPIPPPGHRVLPDGGVSLCFQSVRDADGRVRTAESLFMGPIRTPRFFDPPAGLRIVGVQLKPEWSVPLIGISAGDHVDALTPLRELWRPAIVAAFDDELQRASNDHEAIRSILVRLARRMADARVSRRTALAHTALEEIRRGHRTRSTLASLPDAMGVSERHLRRVVQSETGQSPKLHQRIWRLGRAVALADAAPDVPNWSRLAAALGYCDQAHLIRDYRLLTGATPCESYGERRLQRRHGPAESGP